MPNLILFNPTLEESIPITVALVKAHLGDRSGKLPEYGTYNLTNLEGQTHTYVLTHPIIQFVALPRTPAESEQKRIDVFEPTITAAGGSSWVYLVLRSIVFDGTTPVSDPRPYVIKKIIADVNDPLDKPNKPPAVIRAVRREQYLASQLLGTHYQVLEEERYSFLHMHLAPGKTLDYYWDKLNAEQYLSLSCALLEQIPAQLDLPISFGKHAGKKKVHCDIKFDNIFADYQDGQWVVTLIDFGLAKALRDNDLYASKKPRGHIRGFDSEMVRAASQNKPVIYSKQTDAYALFKVIAELAGAKYESILSSMGLLENLTLPTFKNMGFDSATKSELSQLLHRMLLDKRDARLPLPEALHRFKQALLELQSKKISPSLPAPVEQAPTQIAQITQISQITKIPFLQQCLEMQIEEDIQPGRAYNTIRASRLSAWIKTYRTHYSLLNEGEVEQLNQLIPTIHCKSRYVWDFIRFTKILERFDEHACARLLLRHANLANSLVPAKIVHKQWKKRCVELITNLPLQVNSEDDSFYQTLSSYQKNATAILEQTVEEESLPLFDLLRSHLETQISVPFLTWLNDIDHHAQLFNSKYDCYIGLMDLLEEMSESIDPTDSEIFTPSFLQSIGIWVQQISEEIGKANNLEELRTASQSMLQRAQLVEFLGVYRSKVQALESEESQAESSSSLNTIKPLFAQLDFSNATQIKKLIEYFETLPYLATLHELFSNPNNCLNLKYLAFREVFNEELKMLTGHNAPTDAKNKISLLVTYICRIVELDQFFTILADEAPNLEAIQPSLTLLLANQSLTLQLYQFMGDHLHNNAQATPYLRALNSGLNQLLSQPATAETGQQILDEFKRFFRCPHTYRADNEPFRSSLFTAIEQAEAVDKNAAQLSTALR